MPLSLGFFGRPRIDSMPRDKSGMKRCKKCKRKSFAVAQGKKCTWCGHDNLRMNDMRKPTHA